MTVMLPDTDRLAADLVIYLETGSAPTGLFAADVFCDFTPPLWHLQAAGVEEVLAIRRRGHPWPGEVTVRRCDPTPSGFVIEVEERWIADGRRWYCRELMRADARDGAITEISVYCAGDWDEARQAEHAAAVSLLRP